jgi:hypothetical protein
MAIISSRISAAFSYSVLAAAISISSSSRAIVFLISFSFTREYSLFLLETATSLIDENTVCGVIFF